MLSSHDSWILRAFVESTSKASLQSIELQRVFNCCTKLHCMDLIQSLLMSKEEKLPLTSVRFRFRLGFFLRENDYALLLLNIYDEKRQQIKIYEQTPTKQKCQPLKYWGRWAFKICHSTSIVQFKGTACTRSSERVCGQETVLIHYFFCERDLILEPDDDWELLHNVLCSSFIALI